MANENNNNNQKNKNSTNPLELIVAIPVAIIGGIVCAVGGHRTRENKTRKKAKKIAMEKNNQE